MSIDLLIGASGALVTLLVVVGMILITPKGVRRHDVPAAAAREDGSPAGRRAVPGPRARPLPD
jgi:uncharacterized iron-regulated membrane protein